MDYLHDNQIELLKIFGVICFMMAFFVLITQFQSLRRKRALFYIEFSTGIMLISDMLTYIYRNYTDEMSMTLVRIAYFMVFIMLCFIPFSFTDYMVSVFMGKDRLHRIPKRLKLSYAFSLIGIIMGIISQFTHWYYYVDEANQYHRGPFFFLSMILPGLVVLLHLSVIIQHRNLCKRSIVVSLVVFELLPVVAGVVQYFNQGVSLMNLSVGISSIVVYTFCIEEQNSFMIKVISVDVLTGLPNNHGYMLEVEKKMNETNIKDYCSLYLDIVHMSSLNSKYGNEVGNQIIKEYSKKLREKADESEIVARLGGNYFVVLLKKVHAAEYIEFLSSVPVSVKVDDGYEMINISAIVGAYDINSTHVLPEHVISYPGQALNLAKNVYKKPYLYLSDEVLEQIKEDRKTEELLSVAMKNREFIAYYQPKVDSRSGKVVGAEALARWQKNGEILPPAKFIPIMEKNGSICQFDYYMLEKVCSDIRMWLDNGFVPPMISINFSRMNLGNNRLAEDIALILKKYSIPVNLVQIEVTETIDEYPMSALKKAVTEIQKYGIAVSIDDFGVGSSSIGLLKEIDFDVVKIDKQFVDYDSEKDVKILSRIIEFAKTLNAEVIAEGVEEKEQVEKLSELGCHNIQGYFYSKPLSRKDFEIYTENSLPDSEKKTKTEKVETVPVMEEKKFFVKREDTAFTADPSHMSDTSQKAFAPKKLASASIDEMKPVISAGLVVAGEETK